MILFRKYNIHSAPLGASVTILGVFQDSISPAKVEPCSYVFDLLKVSPIGDLRPTEDMVHVVIEQSVRASAAHQSGRL